MSRVGIAVFVLALVSGCRTSDVTLTCPGRLDCHFTGLEEGAKHDGISHVVIVHGMGESDPGYACALITTVARRLGYVATLPQTTEELHTPKRIPPSILTTRTFGTGSNPVRLRTYEVTWAPLTGALKRNLSYDATPAKRERRARFNDLLKRELMNQRFADPVIYLGDRGKDLKHPIKYVLCRLAGGEMSGYDCLGDDGVAHPQSLEQISGMHEVFFVTQSLGSRITYDAIGDFLVDVGRARDAGRPLALHGMHLKTFFMLANQLPLLELAGEKPFQLQTFEQLREATGRHGAPFTVVAITDPNDLLSYGLPDEMAAANPSVRFANVTMPIGRYLTIGLVDPLGAHTNHTANPIVQDSIIRGSAALPPRAKRGAKVATVCPD